MFNWGSRGHREGQREGGIFEQIIAENFPNLGRETGIQIQETERFPPQKKSIKTTQHLDI